MPRAKAKPVDSTEATMKADGTPMKRQMHMRTDEELRQDLLNKLAKLQDKIDKKYTQVYAEIGRVLCKEAGYDVEKLTEEQKNAILSRTDEGKAIAKEIAAAVK